jgi:molybdopterin-guanine dinucleotide biosynthesis protein A
MYMKVGVIGCQPPLNGLVLASASDMTPDKVEAQVQYYARLLSDCCRGVYVSVRPDQLGHGVFLGLRLIPEAAEGFGQVAGILGAFERYSGAAWLAVVPGATDLRGRALRQLARRRDPEVFVTAYREPRTGLPELACAIYEPKIQPLLAAAAASGQDWLKLLREVAVRLVDPRIAAGGPLAASAPAELVAVH